MSGTSVRCILYMLDGDTESTFGGVAEGAGIGWLEGGVIKGAGLRCLVVG